MIHLVVTWFLAALGFLIASALLGDGFKLRGGLGSGLVVAALFGILNALVGWLVFLGLGVATLGLGFFVAFLTRIVANAIVLKLTDLLTDRLTIRGFSPALLGAVIIGVVASLGEFVLLRHPHHRFF